MARQEFTAPAGPEILDVNRKSQELILTQSSDSRPDCIDFLPQRVTRHTVRHYPEGDR